MRFSVWMFLFVLLAAAGCGDGAKSGASSAGGAASAADVPDEQKLWLVMTNKTGADLWHFDLDVGGEHVTYQIFSNNYTFSSMVYIQAPGPLKLSYQTKSEGGEAKSADLGFTVEPKLNGGKLSVTFLPNGKAETQAMQIRNVAWTEENSTAAFTVPAAQKVYDALELGMNAAEVELVCGTRPQDAPTWSIGKQYGLHGMKETVELQICLKGGKVVRVAYCYPNDPDQKGKFIAEKGASADGWSK
ncbi:MAG: hypothetical protein L6R28_13985 [Planctomycetes bacterium]|nr:hypothetical protein [Planctomycetota bacterium]